MSPFKALYGQDPSLLIKGVDIPSRLEEINQLGRERDELLQELRNNLLKARDQTRRYANNHRRELIFQEGDWIFFKLQPYRMRSLARKPNEKLSPRFYGPYKVIQKIGEVAYRLELPEGKQDTSGFPCIFAQKGSSTHLFPSAITYNHE